MKKFYVLIVVCFSLFGNGFAQEFTWNGGASGDWNISTNWLPVGIPDEQHETALFTSSATVTLGASANITLDALRINGSGTDVTITTQNQASNSITVINTSPLTGALSIANGSTLRLNTGVQGSLSLIMAPDSKGTIDGTLVLDGTNDPNYTGALIVDGAPSNTTQLNISNTGAIISKKNSASIYAAQDGFLNFNAGAQLRLEDRWPIVPVGTYSQSSTILVTGLTDGRLLIEEIGAIGNLTFDCPNLTALSYLNLPHGITVAGNITVLNTNGQHLVLMNNAINVSQQTEWSINISGDLIISNDSRVLLSSASGFEDQIFTATVRNVSAGGLSFGLQGNNNNSIKPATLIVKGNIEHTNGSFGAGSTAVNQTTDLFVIEMGGSNAQTISSSVGFFDNDADNDQLTLKINKPTSNGTVSLLSPLKVGKLNLLSGRLVTSATNHLTVRNTSEQPNVLVSTESSFVDGPLRRVVATANEVVFPTGNGTMKRPVSVLPTNNSLTTFEATFIQGSFDGTTVFPLDGVENNYRWEVNRIGAGADARVKLTLNGAITGADAADAIVVAKYNGTDWVRASGNGGTFLDGNASTGNVQSEVQTSFSLFTFGYGIQEEVLPINLESFSAKKVNSAAQLNWRISENSNPVSFEIMKSGDGINFSKTGTVGAVEGKLIYDFTDNSLLTGNNYYRLRMLDKDGVVSFSNIVVVMNGTKGVMISSMIPTMVVDRAKLNITSSVKGTMQLVITDISGRFMQIQNASITSGNQEIWLNASRLSPGIFQVTGYINGEKTATIRFFKR